MPENNPTEAQKKHGVLFYIAVVLGILLILGVIANANQKKKNEENSTNTVNSSINASTNTTNNSTSGTPSPNLTQTFRNPIGNYQIHYPSGWIVDQGAVTILGVAIKEKDQDFSPAVEIYAIPNNDSLSLEEAKNSYTGGALLLSSEGFLGFRVKSQKQTTFQGMSAFEVSIDFQDKKTSTSARGKMIIFQNNNINYALFAKGPRDAFADDEKTFNEIIASFSLI